MRRAARTLLAVAACVLGGCSALGVQTFSGSYIALALSWPTDMGSPPPVLPGAGKHFDLWAQLSGSQLIRLSPEQDTTSPFPGFDVRWALNPNEPCIIRSLNPLDPGGCYGATPSQSSPSPISQCGEHLLSLDAQLDPSSTPALEQMALADHVRSVVPTTASLNAVIDPTTQMPVTGEAAAPLLVLVRHCSGNCPAPPAIAFTTDPSDPGYAGDGPAALTRLEQCPVSVVPYYVEPYYVGNPQQFTKPLSGVLYGFFNFQSSSPPQNLGGITLPTPTSLDGLQQLFFTVENDDPPPTIPSADLVFIGTRLPDDTAGRGTIHMAIIVPQPTGSPLVIGTASVETDLDQGLD